MDKSCQQLKFYGAIYLHTLFYCAYNISMATKIVKEINDRMENFGLKTSHLRALIFLFCSISSFRNYENNVKFRLSYQRVVGRANSWNENCNED